MDIATVDYSIINKEIPHPLFIKERGFGILNFEVKSKILTKFVGGVYE